MVADVVTPRTVGAQAPPGKNRHPQSAEGPTGRRSSAPFPIPRLTPGYADQLPHPPFGPPAGPDKDPASAPHRSDHRMKSSLQLVASMLALQARRIADASASRVLDDARQRLLAIAALHEQVEKCRDAEHIDLGLFLRGLSAALAVNKPDSVSNIAVAVDPVPIQASPMVAMKFGLLVCELAASAFQHAYPPAGRGEVRVGLERTGEGCRLTVQADGTGLAAGLDSAADGGFGRLMLQSALVQLAATMTTTTGAASALVIDVPSLGMAADT